MCVTYVDKMGKNCKNCKRNLGGRGEVYGLLKPLRTLKFVQCPSLCISDIGTPLRTLKLGVSFNIIYGHRLET